jgi:hypothetical protein
MAAQLAVMPLTAAAAHVAAAPASMSPVAVQVVVRVKRKREELPADTLILEPSAIALPDAKRRATEAARAAARALAGACLEDARCAAGGEVETTSSAVTAAASGHEAAPLHFRRVASVAASVLQREHGNARAATLRLLQSGGVKGGRSGAASSELRTHTRAGGRTGGAAAGSAISAAEAEAASERATESRRRRAAALVRRRKAAAAQLVDGEGSSDRGSLGAAPRARGALPQTPASCGDAELSSTGEDEDEGDDFTPDVAGRMQRALRRLYRVFDVVAGPVPTGPSPDAPPLRPQAAGSHSAAGSSANITMNGAVLVRRVASSVRGPSSTTRAGGVEAMPFIPLLKPQANRILTPLQRKMDKAIFDAQRTGEFAAVFEAMRHGCDVNFQRVASDLSTALIAATQHGNERVVRALLQRGALVRVPDMYGRTAWRVAHDSGHHTLASLLRGVLQEEEEELATWGRAQGTAVPATTSVAAGGPGNGAGHDASDDEYDVYVMTGERSDEAIVGATVADGHEARTEGNGAGPRVRIVRLDPLAEGEVTSLFYHAQGGGGAGGADDDDELLVADQAGSSEEDSADSEDSNREDAPGADYPEDDAWGDTDSDDSDGAQQRGHAKSGRQQAGRSVLRSPGLDSGTGSDGGSGSESST